MTAPQQPSGDVSQARPGTSRRRFLTLVGAAAGGAVLASMSGIALAADAGMTSTSGTLTGSRGGSFADFEIDNPSGDKITVTLDYSPFVAVDAHRVGVSVWQNGKRLARATGTATGFHEHTNSSKPSVSVTPKEGAGTVLIRVFNYSASTVSYTLAVSGATFTAATAPTQPEETRQLGDTATGSLDGNTGGSFAVYRITQPSGSAINITMVYNPFDGPVSHAVGFEVWQNGKELGKAHGTATGLHDHTDDSAPSLKVTPSADGGTVLIKVFNYSNATINYTITVPGVTLVQTLSQALQHATPLSEKQPVSGTLVGSTGGSFANYEIASPTGAKLTVAMEYDPFDATDAHQIGIAVFQKGKRVAHATGQASGLKDKSNSNKPTVTFTPSASGGSVLVRVFNYSSDAISYTLTLS